MSDSPSPRSRSRLTVRPRCSSSGTLPRRRATHLEFGFRGPIPSAWMGASSLCMRIRVPGPSATSASTQRRPGSMAASTSGRRPRQTRRTMRRRGPTRTSISRTMADCTAGPRRSCTPKYPVESWEERRRRQTLSRRPSRIRRLWPTRIGADRLVEIRGKDGTVTQTALLAFTGSYPGQWAWTPLAPVTVALGYHAVELSVPLNASNLYVESGDFWGSVDSTTVVPAFALLTSSFKVSSANTPLSVPWQQVGPQPTATLIDPNSNAATTVYNQQRKVVRAGFGAGPTPCDATNSAGCWYTVFYDQFAEQATTAPSTETITLGTKVTGTFPA